ncbi:M14 family zinc carboxypeptidase [Streptomyces cyaneofuscatus]|uniref:M14 family zinc carboxypeptidase n=1 Tax=Streptomyces cyaneofuscatus TaxID=66883 RepID=UPI003441B671
MNASTPDAAVEIHPTLRRAPSPDEIVERAEALVAEHPALARLGVIGRSRAGEPLRLLSIGEGERRVLVTAGAHSNEQVGGATVLELAGLLAGSPELLSGTAWDFVLCLDPDASRLADAGPVRETGLASVFEGFYRAAGEEQPEWAPSFGAWMPESDALLRLVRERRPYLQVSLHGVDVGGTFLQTTRAVPGLGAAFAASARRTGIPVESASYDAFFWDSDGPGVFVLPPADRRNRFEANIEDARTSTWYAPHAYGGRTLIVEVPQWTDERFADPTPLDDGPEVLRATAAFLRSRTRTVTALLKEAEPHAAAGPFLRAITTPLGVSHPLADEWDPKGRRDRHGALNQMTRARQASLETIAHRLPIRISALLARALEGPGRERERLHSRATGLVHRWCDEFASAFDLRAVPFADQVAHQGATVLAAARLTAPDGA